MVVGLAIGSSDAAFAAVAQQSGGSGYSGKLSRNRAIRQQQVNADPATDGATKGEVTSPLAEGAPRRGSTSVSYNPEIVTIDDVVLGRGYVGRGFIEVFAPSEGGGTVRGEGDDNRTLQDLAEFLVEPLGPETGYVQLLYRHGAPNPEIPSPNLFGPSGEPEREIPVADGFTEVMSDGPPGFDTHAFFFNYLEGVPETTVAEYTIYADEGTRGNNPDFLVGVQNGREFRLGPDDLSSATVRGNLVPLPPAAWAGLTTLAGMGAFACARRRRRRLAGA